MRKNRKDWEVKCFKYATELWLQLVVAQPRGNIVGRINEVARRWAGLLIRWVTVRGNIVLVINQATQANSAWPSLRG